MIHAVTHHREEPFLPSGNLVVSLSTLSCTYPDSTRVPALIAEITSPSNQALRFHLILFCSLLFISTFLLVTCDAPSWLASGKVSSLSCDSPQGLEQSLGLLWGYCLQARYKVYTLRYFVRLEFSLCQFPCTPLTFATSPNCNGPLYLFFYLKLLCSG